MKHNKDCDGCYLKEIKTMRGEVLFSCEREKYETNSVVLCPCRICLIKGMCKIECQDFLDYNEIIGYGKEEYDADFKS